MTTWNFKKPLCIVIAVQLVCGSTGLGQHTSAPPSIEWQQSFGGSKDDFLLVLQPTADGGFIVGGETSSGISGNKTTPSLGGWTDYWILRLDSQGNKLWEQTLGGAGDDRLTSVIQTSDGGFILGGMSDSATNSIKTDPGYGRADFWVVRLDAAGNKLWDRCYGGASGDSIYAMRQINDGGFIFGGWSGSTPGGNKSSPLYGSGNYWIVRVDAEGNKLWDASFGGGSEYLLELQQASDGGFILGGQTGAGVGGNKTSPNFGTTGTTAYDFWIVKTDAAGQKLWEREFGGVGTDYFHTFSQTADGGLLLGGSSRCNISGNKTSTNYSGNTIIYYDYWVVRTDSEGNWLWDQTYGGTHSDRLADLCLMPDQGFIALGQSYSAPSGNKTSTNFAGPDYWIVRADASGNKLWEQILGGDGEESFEGAFTSIKGSLGRILPTSDGGFLVGGYSKSGISGNKTTPNYGGFDFWLVKWSYPVSSNLAYDPSLMTNAVTQCQTTQTSFNVWNLGLGTLTYTTMVDVPWLSIAPAGGACSNQTNVHTIIANPSQLPVGTHQATITITPEGQEATPGVINYFLQITQPPLSRPQLMVITNTVPDFAQLGFRFQLTGTSYCFNVVTEYSTNLSHWIPFQTNQLDGSPIEQVDWNATNSPRRFYRSRVME